MDFVKLPEFCRAAVAIDPEDTDGPKDVYVRIRCGTSARSARQQWKEYIKERNAKALEIAIREACFQLAESEYTLFLIEAVYKGETGPFATVAIHKERSDTEEYNSREVAGVLAKEMVAQSRVLREGNQDLTRFASDILDKNADITQALYELKAENTILGFVMDAEKQSANVSNMEQALQMFGPMVPLVLEKLMGGKGAITQKPNDADVSEAQEIKWPEGDENTAKLPNGQTPAQVCDEMLYGLDALIKQWPALLTPARVQIVAGWWEMLKGSDA